MPLTDKLTLKALVTITAWLGLLLLIAYSCYKFPHKLEENFDTLLQTGLTILTIAVSKWLFEHYGQN